MGRDVGHLEALTEGHQQKNQLGIHQRRGHPEDLGVDLIKLPVAPLLGPLAAKHGADGVELAHRVLGVKPVLDVGAHHRGGRLRTQGQQVALAVGEGVHLFFDDVGVFADAAGEQFGFLHDGNADLGKTEFFKKGGGRFLDVLPELHLAGQNVLETSDKLDHVKILCWGGSAAGFCRGSAPQIRLPLTTGYQMGVCSLAPPGPSIQLCDSITSKPAVCALATRAERLGAC